MLCFMETQIKTQYGLIKYERATKFTLEEGSFLSKSIKEAFLLLNFSAQKLKKGEVDESLTATLFKDASGLSATLDGLIASFKDKSLKCVRESVYEGNEGETEALVLSSVSEDSGEIKIYDAFFDTKQIGDDRAGVIIHEAAHLAGLRGEGNADSAGLESAEAVKNFCLCVNGRLSLEEIAAEAEAPENPDSDELTYNPDQARAPKGQSNGGQWVAEGDNGGASKGGESKSAQKSASAAAENASPAEEEEEEEAQSKDANSQSEKNEAKGERNYIDSLGDEEKKLYAEKGISYEDYNFTTRMSDKYKKDISEKNSKVENDEDSFIHGGFGNEEISVGEDPSSESGAYNSRIWGALDGKLDGLEKDSLYTIIQKSKVKNKFMDNNEISEKHITAVHEIKSDENGRAIIKRVGVVNDPLKDEKKGFLEKIEIELTLEILDGGIRNYFERVEKTESYKNSIDYIARHATLNGGGKIQDSDTKNLETKPIFSGKFEKKILELD